MTNNFFKLLGGWVEFEIRTLHSLGLFRRSFYIQDLPWNIWTVRKQWGLTNFFLLRNFLVGCNKREKRCVQKEQILLKVAESSFGECEEIRHLEREKIWSKVRTQPKGKKAALQFCFYLFSSTHERKITKFAKIIAFPSFGKRNPLAFVKQKLCFL